MKIIPFHNDADISVFNRMLQIMQNLSNEGVFCGTYNRLACSIFAFLINEKGKDVGFIYFVDEGLEDILFMDIGILANNRKTGLAYAALEQIINEINNKYNVFLVSEISLSNINAIKVTERYGGVKVSDRHYLLQPERHEEFLRYLSDLNIDLNEHNYGERRF